jgi:hypothetical protein
MPVAQLWKFRLWCDDCDESIEFESTSSIKGIGSRIPDDLALPYGWRCVLKVGVPGLSDTKRRYYCPSCAPKHKE